MATQRSRKPAVTPARLVSNAPKRQYKAAEQVIDTVRRGILSGELEAGTRLPNEKQLAEDFGLSQSTVREAIRVLEYMSLIEVRHGSGMYITGDTQGFITKSLQSLLEIEKENVGLPEIFTLRRVLSLFSIELAAEKATEQNLLALESLEAQVGEAFESEDYRAIVEASLCFQSALSAAAHNPLVYALESFLIESALGWQLQEWLDPPQGLLDIWVNANKTILRNDRKKMINALRKRNKKQCVSAMDKYLKDQIDLFSTYKAPSEVSVFDSELMYAASNAGLNIPTYQDFHNLSEKMGK